jgi:chromosome segregation protein
MKIKEIDLVGFKSFGDKTTLQLHDGITCIVGPNGCGKSNIVDAFRWVLGEQSAKSLRGDKMDEVIFQGSATKKSRGMAEVRLCISTAPPKILGNGNGSDSSEDPVQDHVEVARRLYRSGESEYALNKRICRLKDIRDLFLDTGLDVKSYSILDQGRMAEILNAKPIDRRFLIEEVAGVMKYKVRKAEAVSKLTSSKENLQRINDIVVEVKRQINSLDRLAKKAERYKRLADEFRALDLRIAKREYVRIRGLLDSLGAKIETLREALSSRRADFSTLENNIASNRIAILEKEKVLAELENRLNEKARLISDLERNAAVLKNEIENRKEDIVRLTNNIEELDSRKESLVNKTAELQETEKTLLAGVDESGERLREKREETAGIDADITDKEEDLDKKRKELFSLSDTISGLRNDMGKLQSSLETIDYRESAALRDKEGVGKGLDEGSLIIAGLNEGIEDKKNEIARQTGLRDSLVEEINNLRLETDDKKDQLSREKEELAGNLSRLDSLKELIVDKSLYEFLAESGEGEHLSCAILSNIISTGTEYEIAVESALAEHINSIIIDNIDDVFSAINTIKEKNLGKTSILYADICSSARDTAGLDAEPEQGIIGSVSEFVNFEASDAGSMARAALNHVYITRDLNAAIEYKKSAGRRDITFVTLAGELVTAQGFIIAGKGKDILKRKREIRELQRDIDNRQANIAAMENEILSLTEAVSSKTDNLETINSALIELEKDISVSSHSLQGKNDEIERMKRRLSLLDTELATITAERNSLRDVIVRKDAEIMEVEGRKNALNENIEALQSSLASVRSEYDARRSHMEELKAELAALREKQGSLKREMASVAESIEDVEMKKLASQESIADAQDKIESSIAEMKEIGESTGILVAEASAIEKERLDRREVINSDNMELVELDEQLKGLRAEIDIVSEELSADNTIYAENRVRLENVETAITQKYMLDIGTEQIEIEGSDPVEDDKRALELNESIQTMGPVNIDAIEEYEELKTRHDFMSRQQQDLTMSIAELEEAISRINTTTKKKLQEAYDALREKFQKVFNYLFGIGKADLLLTETDNILEAGLDIIAQPPGKKLQNINLLSGGEKALTSLALLFAGFLIKPSPLCILDEADAPLDESNTVRFAQLIRDLAKETQFIVITHNRSTMEAADFIYGITMEEPGISKTISLKLSEAESITAV